MRKTKLNISPDAKAGRPLIRTMIRIATSASLFCIGGCVTWGQMDHGLQGLAGKNLSYAVTVLGYPASDRTVAGMRLVTWANTSSGVLFLPQASTTTGYVGAVPYSSTTNYLAPMPYSNACEITLRVNSSDIVEGYQYHGNLGGCGPYIKALKHGAGNSSIANGPYVPELDKASRDAQNAAYRSQIK